MKRNLVLFVLVLLLGGANVGCLDTKQLSFSWAEKTPAPVAPTATRQEKPVTADQIHEDNAHDKVNSLMLELDRDEQGGLRIDAAAELNGSKK
ncbi:MAG: hypothetical protein ACJ8FY_15695 [Gemmataceae bacterium]